MRKEENLKTAEVAAMLNVTIDSIRTWHKKGLLPAVRTPGGHLRFRKADVVRFYQQYQRQYNGR